ncbi:PAS domain-containing sensor histidine kinase [Echinicola sp. 20G]|uniref:sensor histidine kinase n=1 Tax=Echinicola sp. 20G TaxID=2781961 RepID=UPI00190FFB9F|nr:ATP-binding protein [Echinicola sp. 20G]
MVYKSAIAHIITRVLLILLTILSGAYLLFKLNVILGPVLLLGILILQVFELIKYNQRTNEKITRFLESIQYADFTSSFTHDSQLGGSYRQLNQAFNKVMDEFKKTRAEKEEQVLFLRIIIQHINIGIISYSTTGKIGLVNNAAKHLLQITQFKDIHDLKKISPEFLEQILSLKTGEDLSTKINGSLHLNVRCTELKMGGKQWFLLSFQDISAALKQQELDAWQNLTKVLRHEIMNSITPIATLVNSLQTILEEDVYIKDGKHIILDDGFEDLQEGLQTISGRSRGLVGFVNAYRDYTSIPKPEKSHFSVQALFEDISTLLKESLEQNHIQLISEIIPQELCIHADREQILMILINLVKNAREALEKSDNKVVQLKAGRTMSNHPFIQVVDFGPGIQPASLENIFVPFFTTKNQGSGIGLAISRQIMNMHRGNLEVNSVPNKETVFTLRFES